MKLEQLREKQSIFQAKHNKEAVRDIGRRLGLFYQDYPIKKMGNLPIEAYVYGRSHQSDEKTFRYWMEKGLSDFGMIAGCPCSQYGVWHGIHGQDKEIKYRNNKRYGHSPGEAYQNIRRLIAELRAFGKAKDYKGIAGTMIADKFKGNIQTTYSPDTYISIYTDFYLNDIVHYFNRDEGKSPNEKLIYKQLRLIKWKQENDEMRCWDMPKLAMPINDEMYLYFYPPENQTRAEELNFPEFPELGKLNIGFDDFQIHSNFRQAEKKKTKAHNRSKPNYTKKTIRGMAIGTCGEQIVKKFELRKLAKYPQYRDQVDLISEKTNGQGYDIYSFETDGMPMHIEVRSTTKPFAGKSEFFLTEFERSIYAELTNYYVYDLFNVLSTAPKIWSIKSTLR